MYSRSRVSAARAKSLWMGSTLLAGLGVAFSSPAAAGSTYTPQAIDISVVAPGDDQGGINTAAPATQGGSSGPIETVTVYGFAASLEKSTDAKRNAVNFTDTIFAEDIGKFPDNNIAESLNRIPGVTIIRDTDDEGVNVQIRGLGTNFTKILLNNAQIAVASTGATDAVNNNREVDLNMFPTELFTQITVAKTPTADTLEGGVAGTVNMRSARPFDNPGEHFVYSVQGTNYSHSDSIGERGAAIASGTWGPFGALVGVAGVHNSIFTKGWEDGNAGWVTPTINNPTLCGATVGCDITPATSIGGNSMSIPSKVPVNVTTGGLVPGQTVNAALLEALNPGVTTTQLANMLIPRLGRSMFQEGSRDRYNAILSLEYRPNDNLHFYFDGIFGRTFNDINRSDLDWGVRAGAGSQPMIPENVVLNPTTVAQLGGLGGVLQSGTFANAQFFLEARPYKEKGDFFSVNPGMDWQITNDLYADLQVNASRSHFFRDSPTFFVVTCPSSGNPAGVPGCTAPVGGVSATFTNTKTIPVITSNLNLDDPNNFQWNNGRVNLQDEKRYTFTDGAHLNLKWGDDTFSVKVGAAYDNAFRNLTPIDASQIWQNAVCGDNPNVYMPVGTYTPTSPAGSAAITNSQPACQGLNTATPNPVPGGYPTWPGLGTGFTSGAGPLVWQGSLIPQSALASYLKPGPTGFITVNFAAMEKASNYNAIDQAAIASVCGMPNCIATYPFATSSNLGSTAIAGSLDEKNYGTYFQVDGIYELGGHDLKYNAGLRWIETYQAVYSPRQFSNPLNFGAGGTAGTTNGGVYPFLFQFVDAKHNYSAFLPALNLVYSLTDDLQFRAAASRTMTRPFPGQMIALVTFSDLTAQVANAGNPSLKPYYSNNYEVGMSWFTGGAGYLGIDMFRKDISDYAQQVTVTQPFGFLAQFGITYDSLVLGQQQALTARTGCNSQATCATGATISVNQFENLPGLLNIDGIELDYVQPLDEWLGDYGLKGFGFTGNLSMLDTTSSGGAPNHPQGVAPWAYNITGYYDHDGVMFRAQYNWNGRTYAGNSNNQGVCLPNSTASKQSCPGGAYLFGASRGELDISSSLELARVLGDIPTDPELTFEVENLTGEPLISYDQFRSAIHSYYQPGRVYLFGFRGKF